MREIKFRAYDKERECIKDVINIDFNTNKIYCVGDYTFLYNGKFELMQYTGLKDKNGVEIYEGDIIKGGIYLSYEVKWDFGECGWNIGTGVQHNYEVIGNIYENPELLEAKQ